MGSKALIVAGGRTLVLEAGRRQHGFLLLHWQGDTAIVEHDGQRWSLATGRSQARLTPTDAPPGAAREIVLTIGEGGHFFAEGAINGRATRFMVDTGATVVSLSRAEADRLRLDLAGSVDVPMQTAGGPIVARHVMLSRLRLGDVEVRDVPAVVTPAPMPFVLLGNSFLDRFRMTRDQGVMLLQKR